MAGALVALMTRHLFMAAMFQFVAFPEQVLEAMKLPRSSTRMPVLVFDTQLFRSIRQSGPATWMPTPFKPHALACTRHRALTMIPTDWF